MRAIDYLICEWDGCGHVIIIFMLGLFLLFIFHAECLGFMLSSLSGIHLLYCSIGTIARCEFREEWEERMREVNIFFEDFRF